MPLHVHSHARVETLAQALADDLARTWPDPFAVVPIVVGSRGMERWLRQQLATQHGIAANLVFPFPRQSLDGLALHLLGHSPAASWWQPEDTTVAWRAERLTFPVLQALRARAGQPAFAAATAYLDAELAPSPGVSARQWAFARQVADVLDKLMHDRHREALRWARDPTVAGTHAWLAALLADVRALDDHSPARVRERLERLAPATKPQDWPVLRLFCLSTVGPADRDLLTNLARHVEVVLYTLAPSHTWWNDLRSQREAARALARATQAAERARILDEIGSQNAVLGQLGVPSRDVQAWVVAQEYTDGTTPAADEADPTTALQWLQAWVGRAGEMSERMPPSVVGDRSIEALSCWGALRQVEVLRDRLLALFQQPDADLAPRDVLVMTPDVERFAPLVAAVFARRSPGKAPDGSDMILPAIPVHIADLGLRRTNPVAEAMLAVLALADGRVSAPQLVDLLELDAVQVRLGLQSDDVADLRDLVGASGMRWALDAADRGTAGQPELDQNTLEFGLERLACGALMAPLADSEVAELSDSDLVPWPVESPERTRRVAALARLLRALRAVRERQSAAPDGRTLAQWRAEWRVLQAEFTATSDAAAWLGAQVHAALDAFVVEAGAWPGLLTLGAVRRALADRFEMPVRGDRPITGAVTMCALQPMRSVPFAVIALLGMDDGAFPTAAAPRAWDPFAAPLPGELDGRIVQRHLLLETLLSARRHLLLLYDGHGKGPEDRRPAAVPVEELLDTLTHLSESERSRWVTQTPLQPWDPAGFATPLAPFDQSLAEAATNLCLTASAEALPGPLGLAATLPADCPPEDVPPSSVSLHDLAEGLAAAQRLFLVQRLRITLPREREPLADREPLDADGLETWQIRQSLLVDRGLRAGEPVAAVAERLVRRLAAEGKLPLAARGAVLVAEQVECVKAALDGFAACQGAPVQPPLLTVELAARTDGGLHRLRVHGTPQAVQRWHDRWLLQWLVPNSEPKAVHHLAAWAHLLAARASGLPVVGARVVGLRDKPRAADALGGVTYGCDLTAMAAQTLLCDLAGVWLLARSRPVPLFERSSPALAAAIAENLPGNVAAQQLRDTWFGKRQGAFSVPGDRDAREVAALFGRYDATQHVADPQPEALPDLAARVWLPILHAREQGDAIAKEWHCANGGQP